ncbi:MULTISPECIES: hypothetical protein [Terribacillus]|uniref:Uncharacterized protein n=1 Tax=Terribacillus saccharophilus TaxID=361277 RepID=A0AAX2EDR0_9BACI|nr:MULTISPECIES: hypothetical protein [Terribacillus]QXE03584.1 hypothetical protein KS242_17520 [Terribacillus sp. DMT04]SEM86677.1 hypothetical protein SAMN04489762_1243 [Terribacillus saccharophilus]
MRQLNKSKVQNNNLQIQLSKNDYVVSDLDILTAVLLLNGKLSVDLIETDRNTDLSNITLIGEVPSDTNNNNQLTDFLDANDDMSMDDVLAAILRRIQ